MPREVIASDIMAAAPFDALARRQLIEAGAHASNILGTAGVMRHQITLGLAHVGLLLEEARPASIDEVLGIEVRPEEVCRHLRRNAVGEVRPFLKFIHAQAVVGDVLRRTGPANDLRNAKGLDAGIELGYMIHLLESGYETLPAEKRRIEFRMTEGILREELALLWRPNTVEQFENHPRASHMFDLHDANLFNPRSPVVLSKKRRWLSIGMQLAHEAADLFEKIYLSETATEQQRIEAGRRMIDMRIRALCIDATSVSSRDETYRQARYAEIGEFNNAFLQELNLAWHRDKARTVKQLREGRFMELIVVAEEQKKALAEGRCSQVRYAVEREDMFYTTKETKTQLKTPEGPVKLNVDAVEEGLDGGLVNAYQVKLRPRDAELSPRRRIREGLYLRPRIQDRFIDDYPGRNGRRAWRLRDLELLTYDPELEDLARHGTAGLARFCQQS